MKAEQASEPTPVMKQYLEVKSAHPDGIVLFRLGDFYEIFGEDARTAASILRITLTSRDKNKQDPVLMCGVPHHAVENYIRRLIEAGRKVVVCEQMEDPAQAKGIVRREVSRVITPGTYEPDSPTENCYILSFYPVGSHHGIALADISTGDFFTFTSDRPLADEINRFSAKEVLCPESLTKNIHYSVILKDYFVSVHSDSFFDFTEAYRYLLGFFGVSTLEGFGLEGYGPSAGRNGAVCAAGGLLSYLAETQKATSLFTRLRVLQTSSRMFLDAAAIKNLELVTDKGKEHRQDTLLGVLDETLTPMGGRFLRDTLLMPLIDREELIERYQAVELFFNDYLILDEVRSLLKGIQDLERLALRIVKGSANARDLLAVAASVSPAAKLREILNKTTDPLLCKAAERISSFDSLIHCIGSAITDSPPLAVKEGGIIKDGFNREVDELRSLSKKGKTFLIELEASQRARTGINSLKVSYNRVFGYYIEITKANLHMVPQDYIRKQTLANAERFVTKELKDYEGKILGAEEKLKALEYHLFREIVEDVKDYARALQESASAAALVDFLQSLATVAKKRNYTKPVLTEEGEIKIIEGRHPVLDRSGTTDRFIPNDTFMDLEDNTLLIITGPNMAGKSTYMRQTALIILMAQMGSFVPAESATIGIVDRIFTRIGASDSIARGQSTFMVEMVETANIVNNATRKSLILLDEVGRGTSTFDGISIAWAVAEYIAGVIGARTLFATHYNELTELSAATSGVKNYNVAVKEWGDEIIFLRKINKGSADKSYGIQVARLAGLPGSIIERAGQVLANLEKEEMDSIGTVSITLRKKKKASRQLELFSAHGDPVHTKLLTLDMNKLTGQEAIALLRELKTLSIER